MFLCPLFTYFHFIRRSIGISIRSYKHEFKSEHGMMICLAIIFLQFVQRIVSFFETIGQVIAIATETTLSHSPWRMTQWSTLTLRATLSGSISPHAYIRIYTRQSDRVRAILVNTRIDVQCTCTHNAAKVEVLSPGSQVPRCTPIAKSSPLWELHSECILHPVSRFGLIPRKTRRFLDPANFTTESTQNIEFSHVRFTTTYIHIRNMHVIYI